MGNDITATCENHEHMNATDDTALPPSLPPSLPEEADVSLYWEGDWPYCVCSSRQGSPLDRSPTVTAVVPQDNLSRVSTPHHKVGVKPGKSHRHDRRLRKEEMKS